MASIPEYDANKAKQVDAALEKELRMKHLSLQNGRVNQYYEATFYMDQLELDWVEEFYFEGLEDIGLTYHIGNHRISGTPTVAGDHPVRLCCKKVGWRLGMPVLVKEFTLVVNPDPRSLWNTIATNPHIEYYKADEDHLLIKQTQEKGSRSMVAASQRGRSHAHEGSPRDDDFALGKIEQSQWYVLSVADGAGSAGYSREGARIACSTAVAVCKEHLEAPTAWFEALVQSFYNDPSEEHRIELNNALYGIVGAGALKAYRHIEQEAAVKQRPIKDYATTLIMVICKKFEFGWFIGALWIGDGGIGVYNKDTQLVKILGEPDGGEFAGQTCFLTMSEMVQDAELYRRLRFEAVDDFTALVLMTDGITDAKFETDANLQRVEKWNALWDDLSKEVDFSSTNEAVADQLQQWLSFWSPGNHDDRTIAILY